HVAFDTCLAASLVLEGRGSASLKALSQRYLQETMLSYDEVVTAQQLSDFSQVPLPLATQYAAADAHQTWALVPILTQELAQQNLTTLYQQIELPLIPVLLAMEQAGIYLDAAVLAQLGTQVAQALVVLQAKIGAVAELPTSFNLNSPAQVAELLFTKLKLPAAKKHRKSGQLVTDQTVLTRLAKIHPVPSLILKYRELTKLKNTYIDQLPTYINPRTNKIHTNFSQIATTTGRLASAEPNLQNIPVAAGFGRQIRAAFKPDPGQVFLAADYSQIELRVLAHLSGDQKLCQAFLTGVDIHQQTAAQIFTVPPAAVTAEQRQVGKRINFSVLYGLTAYGLAQDLDLSLQSAKQYIAAYFASYPGVAAWIEQTVATATAQGYCTTYWGRRRALPALQERNQTLYNAGRRLAINTPVQGTAAEIMKLGMLAVAQQLKAAGLSAKMLLQIHDELLLTVPVAELERTMTLVQQALEGVVNWRVPLVVS
ncbi:MAG TPA: DNA polymerase, partial [Candidatus Babeliales bacterium]|nr:DNA polymerase [Candidatus Babeliales bacterium]